MTASRNGFTLIEVLLASFIFMSVVTIAVGSFTSQLTLQSSTSAQRNVQQAAQSIIEAVARDVRTHEEFTIRQPAACRTINGSGAPNAVLCGNELRLVESGGDKRYVLQGDTVRLFNPGGGQNDLTDTTIVRVTDFLIEGVEPDMSGRSNTRQPFVVISLTVQNVSARAEEITTLTLRTMVTSRLFDRYQP